MSSYLREYIQYPIDFTYITITIMLVIHFRSGSMRTQRKNVFQVCVVTFLLVFLVLLSLSSFRVPEDTQVVFLLFYFWPWCFERNISYMDLYGKCSSFSSVMKRRAVLKRSKNFRPSAVPRPTPLQPTDRPTIKKFSWHCPCPTSDVRRPTWGQYFLYKAIFKVQWVCRVKILNQKPCVL